MGTKRLSDRIHVHGSGENQPAFSGLAFEKDDKPRSLWEVDDDTRRQMIAERSAKAARETRLKQFGASA